jgi:hypothetical protein
MQNDPEITITLYKLLRAIQDNDPNPNHETTIPELTLYKWRITPQWINSIPFYDFMMSKYARLGSVFGTELTDIRSPEKVHSRFDLASLHIHKSPAWNAPHIQPVLPY